MNGLFSYDSKPMQLLGFLGDLILLNILYLVCCIPLFTIGAAQAGLFTACKVLLDKEDDSSPYAAFWRGFTTGFGTVTLAWNVMNVVLAVEIWLAVSTWILGGSKIAVYIAIGVCAVFQTLVPAFHARFGCKWWQLIRNTWFLLFAHPLRSIATAALIWAPMIFFLLKNHYAFMSLTPIWGTLYFSTAFCFATTFLRKPFKTLTDHFNEVHGIKPDEPQALPDEAEEKEKIFSDVPVE